MSELKQDASKVVSIPWGAWYKDIMIDIWFPKNWDVRINRIVDAHETDDEDIKKSILNPIDTKSLKQLAAGKKNVLLAVEDITRPSELEKPLLNILHILGQAGVQRENITFVICNGAHAPMLKMDLEKKLGKYVLDNFITLNHNPYDNLSDTGIFLGKTPVKINRNYFEADLKIAIGSILPHNFAGFSAGAKLILPGLADIATLERTHKFVMMGFRGGVNDVDTNKFRSEIEDVIKGIGVDFFVGIVPNSKRKPAGVFAGNVISAHRAGVEFARNIYKSEFEPSTDVAVMNAYPKDSELIQADTALTPLKMSTADMIREEGVLIITSRCSNGFGYHSLFGPGMRLSRKPIKKRFLKGRDLILFSPHVNEAEFRRLYWHGYRLANDWNTVISYLENRFKGTCSVSIFPTAPIQLL
jgi:nickel-dependent lactate racemase